MSKPDFEYQIPVPLGRTASATNDEVRLAAQEMWVNGARYSRCSTNGRVVKVDGWRERPDEEPAPEFWDRGIK